MKIFKISSFLSALIIFGWIFYLVIYPEMSKTKEVEIPDFKGYNIDECLNQIEMIKLEAEIRYLEDSESENTVLYTMPASGSIVKEQTGIMLYVSQAAVLKWPDFCGLFYEDEKTSIEEFCQQNGIVYFVNRVVNNEVAEGLIIKQTPGSGKILSRSNLVLDVVIHDNEFLMPDFLGKTIDESIYILNSYQVSYKVIYEYSIESFGTVLGQSIAPGTKLLEGNDTYIILYVSKFLDINGKKE